MESGTAGISIGNTANARTWNIGAGNAIQTVNLFNNNTPANSISLGGTASTTTFNGTVNVSGLTASQVVFTNGSKNLVSNSISGSGNVVMSTSPTLVTPILGTPTSGTLTNCTGLPLTTGATGVLPPANGGTGIANSYSITVAGNLTHSGAYSQKYVAAAIVLILFLQAAH